MRRLPVACDPSAFGSRDAFAAHMREGGRLLAQVVERLELADGWALRLPNDDGLMLSAAQWVVGERRCCPFFTFVIERAPDDLWIRITGPEGAKEVLRAELG